MADLQVHVGDTGKAEVVIHDANGNPTTDWDVSGGIQWTTTNPAVASIVDPDLNPQDADIAFHNVSSEDVFVECSFDGRVGPDENRITLRSPSIAVVPGQATGGVVTITMMQVPPPPPPPA